MQLNFKLTRSKVAFIATAILLACIVTACNYGTAYAYSNEQTADFQATTLSYYQNLTITAIVPPMALDKFGIKETPDNAITGQEIQVHVMVTYPLIKDGESSVPGQQPPNHQRFDYIQATSIEDVMSNKSALVYDQDNYANGTIDYNLADISLAGKQRISGIKYSGLIMSAEQAAVCFCALNGIEYENVTEAHTILTLGKDGPLPSIVAMEQSDHIPVDYDVSDGNVDPYNTSEKLKGTMYIESTPVTGVNMPLQFTPTYVIPADLQTNKTLMHTEAFGWDDLCVLLLLWFIIMILLEKLGVDWLHVGQKYYDKGYQKGWADGVRAQANSDNATVWAMYLNGSLTLQQALYLMGEIHNNMNYNLEHCPIPPKVEKDPFDIWALIWAIIQFLMPIIIVAVVAFVAWGLVCNLLGKSKRKLSEALSSRSERTGGRDITIRTNTIYNEAMNGLLAVV